MSEDLDLDAINLEVEQLRGLAQAHLARIGDARELAPEFVTESVKLLFSFVELVGQMHERQAFLYKGMQELTQRLIDLYGKTEEIDERVTALE